MLQQTPVLLERGTRHITGQRPTAYFGQLVSIISDHGGDVVKFAGDALSGIYCKPRGKMGPGQGFRRSLARRPITAQRS